MNLAQTAKAAVCARFFYIKKHCPNHAIPGNSTGNPFPQAFSASMGQKRPSMADVRTSANPPRASVCVFYHAPYNPVNK